MGRDPMPSEVHSQILRGDGLHAFLQLQFGQPIHVFPHMLASGAVGVILDCFVYKVCCV